MIENPENNGVDKKMSALDLIEKYQSEGIKPILCLNGTGIGVSAAHIEAIGRAEAHEIPFVIVSPDEAKNMGIEMLQERVNIADPERFLISPRELSPEISSYKMTELIDSTFVCHNNRKVKTRKPKRKKTHRKKKRK